MNRKLYPINLSILKEKYQEQINSLLRLEKGSKSLESDIENLAQELQKNYEESSKLENTMINLKELKKARNKNKFDNLKIQIESKISQLFFDKTHKENLDLLDNIESIKLKNINFNDIFIVHGHNEEMKNKVEGFIYSIGLNPIIFHKSINQSRTIISKLEDLSNVNFAIILLSGDDYGYPKNSNEEKRMLRARQNVIFEMGYFLAKIGSKRTFILFDSKENFEFPSDLSGVLYEPLDDRDVWKSKLKKELEIIGFTLNNNAK